MLSAKIVGNMMEWNKPSKTIIHTGAAPDVLMPIARHRKEQPANRPSNLAAGTCFMM